MAEIIKDEGSQVFPKEPMDKELLLSSLRDFKKDGVVLGVEKVIEPKKNDFGKVTINLVFTILGSFEECRMYVLDEEGQYIVKKDIKTGKEEREIEIGDGQLKTVFFPFYAVPKGEGLDENTTLLITPGTSSYSVFREAMIEQGELPENMGNQAFSTNFKELKEALQGFEFLGKFAIGGTKRKFNYLEAVRIEDNE